MATINVRGSKYLQKALDELQPKMVQSVQRAAGRPFKYMSVGDTIAVRQSKVDGLITRLLPGIYFVGLWVVKTKARSVKLKVGTVPRYNVRWCVSYRNHDGEHVETDLHDTPEAALEEAVEDLGFGKRKR